MRARACARSAFGIVARIPPGYLGIHDASNSCTELRYITAPMGALPNCCPIFVEVEEAVKIADMVAGDPTGRVSNWFQTGGSELLACR